MKTRGESFDDSTAVRFYFDKTYSNQFRPAVSFPVGFCRISISIRRTSNRILFPRKFRQKNIHHTYKDPFSRSEKLAFDEHIPVRSGRFTKSNRRKRSSGGEEWRKMREKNRCNPHNGETRATVFTRERLAEYRIPR